MSKLFLSATYFSVVSTGKKPFIALMSWEKEKDFIRWLAEESGEIICRYFLDQTFTVQTKSDQTPVTQADRETEGLLRRMIRQYFPEHGILGEEYGPEKGEASFVWVLDPIDGTKSFIAGTPQFGTLIALLHDGVPILGAIHHPITKQLILGDHQVTTLNGRPIRLRPCPQLNQAVLLTTDLQRPLEIQNRAGWQSLLQQVGKCYTWGDCHAYQLLVCGGADIACDPVMSPWDLMALIPVVRGAGGVITDWQGRDPVSGNSILASGPEQHDLILKILNP